MTESPFDRLEKRIDALYGERKEQPIPAVYVVEPPQMPKQTELDAARALVIAFVKEVPELMLLFVALGVVGIRRCWLWLKQWKRKPQVG